MVLQLPFAHINLRFNPFGELALDERGRLAVVDVVPYVRRLREPKFAVQFIGDKGRGKTTHLLAIRDYYPQAAYIHIGEDEPIPVMTLSNPLFIDEIQRVPPATRRKVFARDVSLVIGTHEDVTVELAAQGFEVVTVTVAADLTPDRLQKMLTRRIEWARRGSGKLPTVDLKAACQLTQLYQDDIRAIEAHLYERFQEMEKVGDVQV